MSNRIVWADKDNIFVIRKGKTSNKKITKGDALVQTYTFSRKQWELANTQKGFGMKKFFALDSTNCLDCPFSGNQGKGGCYTHKFNQYVGFLSMLRSIDESELVEFKYNPDAIYMDYPTLTNGTKSGQSPTLNGSWHLSMMPSKPTKPRC